MEVKIPIKKPSVIDTLPNSLSTAEEQLNMLLKDKFFGFTNFIDLVQLVVMFLKNFMF